VGTPNKDYYQRCQFRYSPIYIVPNSPAVNPVQQSWVVKFSSGTNNGDKSYKPVPKHG